MILYPIFDENCLVGLVEVPSDFVAYIGVTLNGFALMGIHRVIVYKIIIK